MVIMVRSEPGAIETTPRLSRGTHRNNPVEQYEAFMKAVSLMLEHRPLDGTSPNGEEINRPISYVDQKTLFRVLGQPSIRPEVQDLLEELQLSAGWVRNHLLPIGNWSRRLREAIRGGLPIREGAMVARIGRKIRQQERAALRSKIATRSAPVWESLITGTSSPTVDSFVDGYEAYVLAPFYDAMRHNDRTNGLEPEVLALVRHRVNQALGERADQADAQKMRVDVRSGASVIIREPTSYYIRKPRSSRREHSLWFYRPLSSEEVQQESLHPQIARQLISSYAPKKGGFVLDPMAGSGTVARAAVAMGHEIWAGDLHPKNKLINLYDAYANQAQPWPPGQERRVDLLVFHPPTYATWRLTSGSRSTARAYLNFIRQVLERHSRLVDPVGYVLLIVQPFHEAKSDVRSVLMLRPPPSHPCAVAIHIAAATNGLQLWYVLAFSNCFPGQNVSAASSRATESRAKTSTADRRMVRQIRVEGSTSG